MDIVDKNRRLVVLAERLDQLEIDADDLGDFIQLELDKKGDIAAYFQKQIDDCDDHIEKGQLQLVSRAKRYANVKVDLEQRQTRELEKFENDLKELQLRRGMINQEFHRYNEVLMAKRKLQARLEFLYKTFESDRIKYRSMIDEKQKNYVTQSIYNQRELIANTRQMYNRFSKETRLAVENVRQNQTLRNMKGRRKLTRLNQHTIKALAHNRQLLDMKNKAQIENSIHLDSLLTNDYRMGDSLKQFMDRKEVLVLGTIHELEDRNKLKERQIHELKNVYYKNSYAIVSARRKINTSDGKGDRDQLNTLARQLNDQSRQLDSLKSQRDRLKRENDALDERLDTVAEVRINLESVARQIVASSKHKDTKQLHPAILDTISSNCKPQLSRHIESMFSSV